MIRNSLTLVILIFTISRAALSAETCDAIKAINLLISLKTTQETLVTLSKVDSKGPAEEANESVKMINQLQPTPTPEADLKRSIDELTTEYVERVIAPLKNVVDSAELLIDAGLKGNSDIAALFNDTFGAGLYARPTAGKDAALLEKGKHTVAYLQSYGRYMNEAQQLIQKLIDKTIACIPTQKEFETYVNGKKVSFGDCSTVTAFEPEAETWGGKIKNGECRHIVTCSQVKALEPQILPSAFWVVDCKEQSAKCPTIEKCAAQVQTGGAVVSPAKMEGVSK